MLSFLAKHPPRSRTCHLTTLHLDGGRSVAVFKPPGDRYLVINRLPPALSAPEAQRQNLPHQGANTLLAPPLHRHLWQNESFHVISGTAKFTAAAGGKRHVRLAAAGGGGGGGGGGDIVHIPRGQAHSFCNASEETDLVIEFALDPMRARTDEAYFRNVWGYRDDLKKAGMQRSIFQVLLFMHHGGVSMVLPGPEVVSQAAGLLLNYIGGVFVGRLLLGYRGTYPEYFDEKK